MFDVDIDQCYSVVWSGPGAEKAVLLVRSELHLAMLA
jgi:hypothetical protein